VYIHVYMPVPNSKYRSPASLPAHHHHGQPQQTATQSSNHVSSLLPLCTWPCKHSIRVCRRIYELVPNRKAHLVQHRDPASSPAARPSLAPQAPLANPRRGQLPGRRHLPMASQPDEAAPACSGTSPRGSQVSSARRN